MSLSVTRSEILCHSDSLNPGLICRQALIAQYCFCGCRKTAGDTGWNLVNQLNGQSIAYIWKCNESEWNAFSLWLVDPIVMAQSLRSVNCFIVNFMLYPQIFQARHLSRYSCEIASAWLTDDPKQVHPFLLGYLSVTAHQKHIIWFYHTFGILVNVKLDWASCIVCVL